MSKSMITPICASIGYCLGEELISSKQATDNFKSNLVSIVVGIVVGSSIEYALGNKKSFAKLPNVGAMMSIGALVSGTISIISSSDDELESSQDKIGDSIACGVLISETIAVVGNLFHDWAIHD